ncbi:hypothetical protein POUND7_011724 [Theobroma cacao]
MPLLRLVVTTTQGLNHIDLSECRRRDIAVARAGTIYSTDCADSVVALLIDVLRKVSAANRFVKQGLWSSQGEYPLGSKLGGKRVGIVGSGSIGSEVAKRLEAFDCSISYNSTKKNPFFSYPFYPNVRELAANCDALIICCALTDETHHLINKEVLSALGKDGVIINIARGPIIDEKELVRCLVEGEIRGAGLDVFEHEPDVPSELFALDNVVMSPHNAVFTRESFEDQCKLVVGNLEAFFSNEPLLTPVVLNDPPHFSVFRQSHLIYHHHHHHHLFSSFIRNWSYTKRLVSLFLSKFTCSFGWMQGEKTIVVEERRQGLRADLCSCKLVYGSQRLRQGFNLFQPYANPRVSTRFTPNLQRLKPTTMAPENPSHPSENDLPYVLILKPPPSFVIFGDRFFNSTKFRFLKAYESPLPLAHFLLAHAQSVQAILSSGGAPVTADTIRLMPLLRLVVTTSQGLNHIDLSECRRRGIVVASAGTIYSADCADSVVALLIDVLRKVSAADRFVKQGLWSSQGEYPLGSKLGGKRVGIVGLGSIGSEVAKRLEAFGCSISYNSRKKKPFCSYPFYLNVRELAANCDALIICCALTDETHHLINKEVLSALGKDGVIVNIARGPIMDEKELVRCLVEGEIRGAGLDVFEHEPDVPNELFALDNVVMSPHNAVFTWESFEDLRKLVVGNLEAFFSNEPLLTPVGLDDQPHFSETGHILEDLWLYFSITYVLSGGRRVKKTGATEETRTKSCCIVIINYFFHTSITCTAMAYYRGQESHVHPSQNLPLVLVLEPPPVFKFHGDQLLKKFQFLKAWESPLPLDQFLTIHAHSVQALLSPGTHPVTLETLRLLPSLGLIVTTSVGLNHIDLPECRRRGISIANAGNLYSEDVADLAVGLLIDVLRKISVADRYVKRQLWPSEGEFPLGIKLRGRQVGIVGLGSIGFEVAKRLDAFGCSILYNSRRKKPSIHYPYYSNICELASNCDVLIICCALTDKTHHMINKEVLLAMGKKGVIVNVGRGAIIDEQEMVGCLMRGEIAGAGLDVFEKEPDVPKELFDLDNVVLSPHRAVHSQETLMALCDLVVGNFEAFFSNKPLLTPVVDE